MCSCTVRASPGVSVNSDSSPLLPLYRSSEALSEGLQSFCAGSAVRRSAQHDLMTLVQPRDHELMSAAEPLIIPRQLAKQQRQLAGAHRALMFDLQNEFVIACE